MSFIPAKSFKRFENCTGKETKWTSLEVRTHPTFLETLISKYDFGPVKLPGLSRNGPLGWVVQSMLRLIQGLSNLLIFILTFDEDLNFSVMEGLNLYSQVNCKLCPLILKFLGHYSLIKNKKVTAVILLPLLGISRQAYRAAVQNGTEIDWHCESCAVEWSGVSGEPVAASSRLEDSD